MSAKISSLLTIKPNPKQFNKNGQLRRGFDITIIQLQDKIRKILSDSDFQFGHIVDDE